MRDNNIENKFMDLIRFSSLKQSEKYELEEYMRWRGREIEKKQKKKEQLKELFDKIIDILLTKDY